MYHWHLNVLNPYKGSIFLFHNTLAILRSLERVIVLTKTQQLSRTTYIIVKHLEIHDSKNNANCLDSLDFN